MKEPESKQSTQRALRDYEGPMSSDTGPLKLPQGFVDEEEEERRIFGLEPVIVLILIFLIVFIAVIAYLVYKMPVPVR